MKLFGYKGCDESRKDSVAIRRQHGGVNIVVAEQLTTKQASKLFKELEQMFLDKKSFIKIKDIEDDLYLIPKTEIGKIKWYRYNKT